MNSARIEKILDLAITYRVEELAALIDLTGAYDIADEFATILVMVKFNMTGRAWRDTLEILSKSADNITFDEMMKEFENDQEN